VTYNFDPETWLENQKRVLDARRRAGEFGEAAHREALEELDDVSDVYANFDIPDEILEEEAASL